LFVPLVLSIAGRPDRAFAYAQVTPVPDIVIVDPQPGQALKGVVAIMGRTTLSSFRSAEVLFGYTNDPSQTWFLIAESASPVEAGLLAEWDTSTLTDGNYTLRLVVNRTDGSRVVVIVPGLRVRNYSPVETSTPTPFLTPTAPTPPGEQSSTGSPFCHHSPITPCPPTRLSFHSKISLTTFEGTGNRHRHSALGNLSGAFSPVRCS
jgi:hypothetical protein